VQTVILQKVPHEVMEKLQSMLENRTGVFAEPNEALPYNTNIIGTIVGV